jgi:hypothetical protein
MKTASVFCVAAGDTPGFPQGTVAAKTATVRRPWQAEPSPRFVTAVTPLAMDGGDHATILRRRLRYEAALFARLDISLKTGAGGDARLEAFIVAVIAERMKKERRRAFYVDQTLTIRMQIFASYRGVDFPGHIRDMGRQHVETGVAEYSVMDWPKYVVDVAVDAIGRIGVGRSACRRRHHGEASAQ